MPPKKSGQTMTLSDFLGDDNFGTWADEMESLPVAPARGEDRGFRGGDRDFGGRGDGYPPRESRYPPRTELPLPTAPPYTAFVGNLAFDISENDVEEFFQVNLKSIKIIKDRDDRPKGFGYVEFSSLEDLKAGLAKTGSPLAGRPVRVSVAEPQKERSGMGDDDKFSKEWRREGPLPPLDRPGHSGRGPSRYEDGPERGERMGFGTKFVPSGDAPTRGPPREQLGPTEAETNVDWRAGARTRPPPPGPGPERSGPRKGSGFAAPGEGPHAAESESAWTRGSRFVPTEASSAAPAGQKSGFFNKSPRASEEEPSDWRSAPRKAQPPGNSRTASFDRSPSDSVPTTPNMGRRKLELLPRASSSTATSPVGFPKAATPSAPRSNPFGAAKPVDTTAAKDKEIEDRLAKDREARLKDRSNDSSIRSGPPPERAAQQAAAPAGEGGSWRERRGGGPSAGHSRPASASHSRATSHDGGATPPTPAKKHQSPFSFAALASEIPVAEGEEDDGSANEGTDTKGVEASA